MESPRSTTSDTDVNQFRDTLRSADDAEKFQLCVNKRDELLGCQKDLEIRFALIEEVMLEECPQYEEKKNRCSQNNDNGEAERWELFSNLAKTGAERRKECLAPIIKVSGLWGSDKVKYYGWADNGWNYCKKLGTAATHTPCWKEAQLKLNQLLLARIKARTFASRSTNPVTSIDLTHLHAWKEKCEYKKEGRNSCTLKCEAIQSSLPEGYAYDRFGLINSESMIASPEAQRPPGGDVPNPSSISEDSSSPPSSLESPSSAPSRDSSLPASPGSTSSKASSLPNSRETTPAPADISSPTMEETRDSVPQVPVRTKLRSVPPVRYAETARPRESALRSRASAPRPRPSGPKKGGQSSDSSESHTCGCSATVAPEFFFAIEHHRQSTAGTAEDFQITDQYAAQRDQLCKAHLLQYASWATRSIELTRKRSTPASPGPVSKRRRLSLPEFNDLSKGSFTNHFTRRPTNGLGNDTIISRLVSGRNSQAGATTQQDGRMLTASLDDFLDFPEGSHLQKIGSAWKNAIAKAGGLDGPNAPFKFSVDEVWKSRPTDDTLFAYLLSSFCVDTTYVYAQFKPNRPVEGKEFATVVHQLHQPDENARYAVNIFLPSDVAKFALPDRLHVGHPSLEGRAVSVNITPKYTFVDVHIDHGMHGLTGGAMGCCKLWATWPGSKHNMDLLQQYDDLDEKFLELWPRLEQASFTTTNPHEVIYLPPGLLHATFTFQGGATPGMEYCSAASVSMAYECWKREKQDLTTFITSCEIGLRFADSRLETARILCLAIKEHPELHADNLLKSLKKKEEDEGKQCPICNTAWDEHGVRPTSRSEASDPDYED